MSIPLDRLYHYIDQLSKDVYGDNVIIYLFYPHGSKKIENLSRLYSDYSPKSLIMNPIIYCYDQEPLNFEGYISPQIQHNKVYELIIKYKLNFPNFNFQQYGSRVNIYDKSLLVHSERRSKEVELYKNNYFIPVYYWSHAIIARDWFRYAQHINQNKQVKKLFLIYNRAWSGTREYRLKFADLLISQDLVDFCHTNVNVVEPENNIHYSQHKFFNQQWCPANVLENYFSSKSTFSHYSADFDINDYEMCDIEIVLETLFDDERLHLTEKSLRPIACGQPFVLASTAGSLEYLRSYGFKTFDTVWDESYDLESDPVLRLQKIVSLMKEISQWTTDVKFKKIQQAQQIADYNKQHFFSKEFFSMITEELKTNLRAGLEELENTNTSEIWFDRRKKLCSVPEIKDIFFNNGPNSIWPGRTRQEFLEPVIRAKKYYLRSLSQDNKKQ